MRVLDRDLAAGVISRDQEVQSENDQDEDDAMQIDSEAVIEEESAKAMAAAAAGILPDPNAVNNSDSQLPSAAKQPYLQPQPLPTLTDEQSATRFLIKQRVCVGNVSRYIPEDKRKLPKFAYKWMIYIQGPPSSPDITPFISRVRFHLHPDYRPNDVIDVTRAPFQVTRYGWGEFPVRVRLFFADERNKTVDLMYSIKLDKSMTGKQVSGGEVWTDLLLDKNTQFRTTTGASESNTLWPSAATTRVPKPAGFGRSRRRGSGWGFSLKKKKGVYAVSAGARVASGGGKGKEVVTAVETVEGVEKGVGGGDGGVAAEVVGSGSALDENSVALLEPLMDQFPLIRNDAALNLPYTPADSLEAFEAMSEEDRNLMEEQRATALLFFIQSQPLASSHPILFVPVQEIVQWCRVAGYTPTPNDEDDDEEEEDDEADDEGIETRVLEQPAPDDAIQTEDPTAPAIAPTLVKKVQHPVCRFCGRRHVKELAIPSVPSVEDVVMGEASGGAAAEVAKLEVDETIQLAAFCIAQIQPAVNARAGVSSLSVAESMVVESVKRMKIQQGEE
ncbi:YEATS domain-containing protein 2 [Podochytrium sp. JEL0797]|nr:YEATS domain-containing protein 2 [Podochytrium sp. JEL0797]